MVDREYYPRLGNLRSGCPQFPMQLVIEISDLRTYDAELSGWYRKRAGFVAERIANAFPKMGTREENRAYQDAFAAAEEAFDRTHAKPRLLPHV